MSHFTVLVVAKDEEELERKLLPYHEYECTGIEEFTEWIDHHDEVVDKFDNGEDYDGNKFSDLYETLDEFAEDWDGWRKHEVTGRFGRQTNPNSKWDWWTVGGRWNGGLETKDGQEVNIAYASELDCTNLYVPFAFIDAEGEWHQKGEMGWFAMVDDSKGTQGYEGLFIEKMKALPEDAVVFLVDCHI